MSSNVTVFVDLSGINRNGRYVLVREDVRKKEERVIEAAKAWVAAVGDDQQAETDRRLAEKVAALLEVE